MLTIANPAEATYNNPFNTVIALALKEAAKENSAITSFRSIHEDAFMVRFTNGDKVLISDCLHEKHISLTWVTQDNGTRAALTLPHHAADFHGRVVRTWRRIAAIALADDLADQTGEKRTTRGAKEVLAFNLRHGHFL